LYTIALGARKPDYFIKTRKNEELLQTPETHFA